MPSFFAASGRLDLFGVEESCYRALQAASQAAFETCWDTIRTPHLFMGLLIRPDDVLRRFFDFACVEPDVWLKEMYRLYQQNIPRFMEPPVFHREFVSNGVLRVLNWAAERADQRLATESAKLTLPPKVRCTDILTSILREEESGLIATIKSSGVSIESWQELLTFAENANNLT